MKAHAVSGWGGAKGNTSHFSASQNQLSRAVIGLVSAIRSVPIPYSRLRQRSDYTSNHETSAWLDRSDDVYLVQLY